MTERKKLFKEKMDAGYGSWLEMRKRCLSPTNKNFHLYGGRGISICKEWDTFDGFLRDMGARPTGMTLERKNVNGDYEPSNCIWIPNKDQSKNTRRTVWFDVGGENLCMKDACKKLGVSYSMVRLRIWKLGWEKNRAINEPPSGSGRKQKSSLKMLV